MERKKDGFDGQRAIVLPQTIKEILNTNELTSLLYITDIGFYPNANGHYRIRKEGAEQHILIYCTDGKGWISTKGEKHNLSKGEFFISRNAAFVRSFGKRTVEHLLATLYRGKEPSVQIYI